MRKSRWNGVEWNNFYSWILKRVENETFKNEQKKLKRIKNETFNGWKMKQIENETLNIKNVKRVGNKTFSDWTIETNWKWNFND